MKTKSLFFGLLLAMLAFGPTGFASGKGEILSNKQAIMAEQLNQAEVEKFFANYALIGNWTAFTTEQRKLLSPHLTTITSDHTGLKVYQAPSGYFASLGDWSKEFSTGPDFHVKIVKVTSTQVVARLHGTLSLEEPLQGLNEIPDSLHQWTEIFTLAADGSIERIEVTMNLFK